MQTTLVGFSGLAPSSRHSSVYKLWRRSGTCAVVLLALVMLSLGTGEGKAMASGAKGDRAGHSGLRTVRGLPDRHPKLNTGPDAALSGPAGGPAQIGRPTPQHHGPARQYTRQQLLDALFMELRDADTLNKAQGISRRIHSLFMQSGSHTLDLLMMRSAEAVESKQYGLALDLLDAVVRLDPEYVEGWNRRATVHFLKEDLGRSLADIEQVLRIEPRHYPALSGFAMILRRTGKNKKALEVFQHVLGIYPLLENAQDAVKSLRMELWGQYH
ncbi:tetratricopeptide repeat protein [Pseudovibrio axinellae]|uniref:tetratricopeptide repeat protein n=1 Tax=Pseudovibrio axinellae TaxID=989403 RepID=UPI001AD91627|nr:tetratricopeptide repeat protein [Pseudovibrio axinellae]